MTYQRNCPIDQDVALNADPGALRCSDSPIYFAFDTSSYFSYPLHFYRNPVRSAYRCTTKGILSKLPKKNIVYPLFVPCDSLFTDSSSLPMGTSNAYSNRKRNRIHSIEPAATGSYTLMDNNQNASTNDFLHSPPQNSYYHPFIVLKSLVLASIVPSLAFLIVFSFAYLSYGGEKIQFIRQILNN